MYVNDIYVIVDSVRSGTAMHLVKIQYGGSYPRKRWRSQVCWKRDWIVNDPWTNRYETNLSVIIIPSTVTHGQHHISYDHINGAVKVTGWISPRNGGWKDLGTLDKPLIATRMPVRFQQQVGLILFWKSLFSKDLDFSNSSPIHFFR